MGTKKIPDEFRSLFSSKAMGHLATIMPDGSPHVTPMWLDLKGDRVVINTSVGRVKDRNMRANPSIAVSVQDPENPYRYVSVKGNVAEIREEGAREHIDVLAKRYLDLDEYPYLKPGMVRVIYEIEVTSVHTSA